jgi:putative ABC transport system permease protein
MTIAMFSLIIFSLTVFSAVNANFTAVISGDPGQDGWDLVATEIRTNDVPDIIAAVVGVLATKMDANIVSGLYVNQAAYEAIFGTPVYQRNYLRIAPDADAIETARGIESALSKAGVQTDSIDKLINDSAAQDRAFTRMFQGFMALGLFVGVAALGVIAFRSVVERRQQIGMLRAIGYQTESVTLTFLLESTFVALMGILSGVVGGVIVSRNLFTIGQFSGEGVDFSMPWVEVAVFVGAAFVVSLFMTWWPSRSASRVPVAEALRYE